MENCTNCRKRLTHEDFELKSPMDWENVCVVCRELPEVKGRWAIWKSQDASRTNNMALKKQHNEVL